MRLYLIMRTDMAGYDEYDSAIVAALCPVDARMIHPDASRDAVWDGGVEEYGSWVAAEDVKVIYLGEARKGMKAGVICASFNAG